jgi:6-phosphogluconolactonase (cycloisomerase 2 family)
MTQIPARPTSPRRPRVARLPVALAAAALALAGCGGGSGDGGSTSITLGGTVSALTTDGLVLADKGATVSVPANATSFTFGTVSGSYDVTILSQPTGQTCTVANGSGTTNGMSVNNVAVSCRAYAVVVSNQNSNSLGQFLVGTDGSLTLQAAGALPTSFSPGSLVLAADGTHGWVTYQDDNEIDTFALDAHGAATFTGGSTGTLGTQDALAVSPDGTKLYTAEYSAAQLTQTAILAGGGLGSTPAYSQPSGVNPSAVAATPDGAHVYVANASSDSLSGYGYDSTGKLVALSPASTSTTTYGSSPRALAVNPNGGLLYATLYNSGRIVAYAIDASTGALTYRASQLTGTQPRGIAVTPSGGYAYVANYGSNTISQYTLAGGSLTPLSTPTVATGSHPFALAISPDGAHLYATNFGDGTISIYAIGANGLLTPLATSSSAGSGPTAIAVR